MAYSRPTKPRPCRNLLAACSSLRSRNWYKFRASSDVQIASAKCKVPCRTTPKCAGMVKGSQGGTYDVSTTEMNSLLTHGGGCSCCWSDLCSLYVLWRSIRLEVLSECTLWKLWLLILFWFEYFGNGEEC